MCKNLHLYPDGSGHDLRTAIAQHHNIPRENITLGAGSDEIITFLARCYAGPGDEIIYSQYGFLMYPIAAKTVGATPIMAAEADLKTDPQAILSKITGKTRLIFIANPNNPTGSLLTANEVLELLAAIPKNIIVVLDAAYAEYCVDGDHAYNSGLEWVPIYDNLVVLRTFSKVYGLAALRLGWCYSGAEIYDGLNRVRGPFNVGMPSLKAGVAALQDQDFIRRSITHNSKWRAFLTTALRDLGLTVLDSAGNFILLRFPDPDRAKAAYRHLEKQGIIVRQLANYGLPDSLRITIGLAEEVQRTLSAMQAFVASASPSQMKASQIR